MKLRHLAFPVLLLLAHTSVFAAGPVGRLYRGARPMAMGGAFIAVADDENAIFMNPAGLAGVERYRISYAAVDVTTSMDVYSTYKEGFDALTGGISSETFDVLAGKDLFAEVQVAPTLLIPNIGIGVIVDGQAGLGARNAPFPMFQMMYQTTNAIQVAWGTNLYRQRRGREALRFGLAAKSVWRRGGYREIPLLEAFELQNGLGSAVGNWGWGYGFDAGLQYERRLAKNMSFNAGAAFLDIGDTKFSSEADPIPGNLGVGLATTYHYGLSRFTLAYDFTHINQDYDWRKKSHLGFELEVPVISIYGGLNGVGLTYGLAFDAWIFRVTALSYREELGELAGQWASRRYTLRFDLKFGL